MVKHNMLRVFLIISSTITHLSAEYLLIPTTSHISQETVTRAFKTMYELQFPTSISSREAVQSLSLEELSALCKQEQAYIQSKLSRISPDLHLIYLPTAIYELISISVLKEAIEQYHQAINKQLAPSEDKENQSNQPAKKTAAAKNITIPSIPVITALLKFLNNATPETIQQLQIAMNEEIIGYLKKNDLRIGTTEQSYANLLTTIINRLMTISKEESIMPAGKRNIKLANLVEIIRKWTHYNLHAEQ